LRAIAALCALALLSVAALAETTGSSVPLPEKVSKPAGVPTYEGREQGDTVEDPFIITVPTFHDTGFTCPFMNDYDEACPYSGSDSPDVVYRFDAPYDCSADIDLCMSGYDTKIYVYENEVTPGSPLACNDDFPGCGPDGYRSWLNASFTEGNTYYIVIDGFGGDCGHYDLNMQGYLPCVWCPEGAFVEEEPGCMDPANDVHNGGCNSDPPVFDHLEPSEETINVCGTSGTYVVGGQTYRDTDWYQIDLANESEIGLRCIANFDVRLGIVDGREGCENVSSFYSYMDAPICYLAYLDETLAPGTWWVWIGPTGFTGIPCGEEYMLELTGYTTVTPVENASWASIKALYGAEAQ
jgi:hypothetical protein